MKGMPQDIRILMVEDAPTDAELIEAELRDAGLSFTAQRVQTEPALIEALAKFRPDIILSDYQLPGFDGLSALRIIQDRSPETPVIMVTGAVGDEMSVSLLKGGAKDYILKDRLARLKPSIERALREQQAEQRRRSAELELNASERHFRAYFERPLVGMTSTSPNKRWLEVNDRLCEMLGYSREELMEMTWTELTHPDDLAADLTQFDRLMAGEIDNYNLEKRFIRKDGEIIYTRLAVSAVLKEDKTVDYIVALLEDISDQHLAQEQLQELAHRDPLTHLPNRRLLDDRLRQAIAQSQRSNRSMAICYLDLDGFKTINDNLGHDIGDQLLITVASRLLSNTRDVDTLARIGGDEFVLLLAELVSLDECEELLSRLLTVISSPYPIGNSQPLRISASIGVTLFPQDFADPDTLMRHADQAMYIAKQNGRNRFQFFDLYLERRMISKRETLTRIQHGLETSQFCLYFQPKVDFCGHAVVGAEALIRWQHPIVGLLEPNQFLPVIENDDLALVLGDWVIQESLRQMQVWRKEEVDLQVSINTFARQLHDANFLVKLRRRLSECPDVPPNRLLIEITETASLPELPMVQSIITECNAIGINFSIDDFGTGYSSLTYLRHLAATELKIDRSFVHDMLTNREDQAIVEGIIALGRAFQRSIVAEGVETSEQIRHLLELGCRVMQGYRIARPMPADQVVSWARNFQTAPLLS